MSAARVSSEPQIPRPYTGAEYLATLDDGRQVYYGGELIRDVRSHPALRNTARSVARLYDELHRPAAKPELCWETDTGSGGYTHKFFRCARSAGELREQRDAIAAWARVSYGWLARAPDYKGAFNCSLGADPQFFGDFAGNARTWYRRIQESCLYLNHAIVTPLDFREGDARPLFSVTRETGAGIFVSGAKMVATNAALNQAIFISHVTAPSRAGGPSTSPAGGTPISQAADPEYATGFMLKLHSPGVKVLLRPSYELAAQQAGAPFNHPLSSRFDENDAILILDDVFIPWEDVLIYRDSSRCRSWHENLFAPVFPLHTCTRLAVRLDFLCALLNAALESTGKIRQPGVKTRLGEAIAWRNLLWSLSDAMWSAPRVHETGVCFPNPQAVTSFRVFAPQADRAVRNLIRETMSGGLIYVPSGAGDLANRELDTLLARYMPAADGGGHHDRIKLVKLLWDAVGSEFAGRNELFELSNAGGPDYMRAQCLQHARESGELEKMSRLLNECLRDYDESGWQSKTWINE